MIQLFVRTTDLKPKHPPKHPAAPKYYDKDEEAVYHDKTERKAKWDCFRYFRDDIERNGIRYALKINHLGEILDGDCRYWIARELGLEYVPIDYNFLMVGQGRKRPVKSPRKLMFTYEKE